MTLQRRLSARARNALLMLGFVAVFLTFGLPRFLAGDVSSGPTQSAAGFARLCREHGGTPGTASNATAPSQQVCTVRYGRRVYRMDAITPSGFDADTAHYQRQGCEAAERAKKASGARGGPFFVYHATTGVCEHRT